LLWYYVIILIQVLDLTPGQIHEIPIYPEGATVRIEAEQSPGHPGSSMPAAFVEGCGTASDDFSLGFVTQYPMDDGNHFIDIDCQENVGSYDPNEKIAYPKGYFDEHFIQATDEIEYHIRFQNTGTDTAFTVVLRDTLSSFLDARTIRPGSSSHDYEFELLENGIVKFTFENILLPDSTTNLEASNGYVKFKVKQKNGNDPGTVINNRAGIYFDFNEPILTETVFHTVEIPYDYIIENVEI